MIDLSMIQEEINSLQEKEPSYSVIEKLSCLYTVRDHMEGKVQLEPKITGKSEFLTLCSKADMAGLFSILDEHMEAVKIIYPREYAAVIRRINNLI